FVEHPTDKSNRPKKLDVPYSVLGPYLGELFLKAFVTGLHSPDERPTAQEWERALYKTWDLLIPCPGANCSHGWVVMHDASIRKCPVCGERLQGSMPVLSLRSESRPGQWTSDGELAVYADGRQAQALYSWHVMHGAPRAEGADTTRMGYFAFHQGKWILVNEKLTSLKSPGGNHVPQGAAVELVDGAQFMLSSEGNGR
ncbi:hypothetical protein, partial [Fundidesulfovibrio magnetotacticus]|uniref:hypothetical protein n=1 Tax=Fundidesulfovibrio magnetotacticus TaxID=2730080 RepID=UPI001C25E36F